MVKKLKAHGQSGGHETSNGCFHAHEPKQQAEMRVRKTVLQKQPEVVTPKNDMDDIPFDR